MNKKRNCKARTPTTRKREIAPKGKIVDSARLFRRYHNERLILNPAQGDGRV